MKLKLNRFPHKIEGYDISHLSERDRVGAVVTFAGGKAVKKNYRNYIIKNAGSGDTAALKEVLERRFAKKKDHPDLLLIDGGKGQLNAAIEIKNKLKIESDVAAIAKREERIYLEDGGSVIFRRGTAERFLFQNIRDEAHRRAITHHKKRREKIPR
jgi:excinuclease ABC subunit C